jgi:hypothetical protein
MEAIGMWLRSFVQSRNEPEKRVTKSKFSYPETAIISIASHGLIQLERKSEYALEDVPKFTVPKGMQIIKYSEVPPGTCNMMTDDKLDEYIEYILSQELDKESMKDAFDIVQDMVPTFKEKKQEIVTEQTKLKSAEKNPVSSTYVHTYDKGYLTGFFNAGDNMLNKTYSTEVEGRHVIYDWQIVLLNAIGQPDLFKLLSPQGRRHHGESGEITLEQMVIHLSKNGVKNIVLFDFSCSNYLDSEFQDIEEPMTGHGARIWKDEMIGQRLFGGRNRKTKSRKSNKKRRSNRKRRTLIKR